MQVVVRVPLLRIAALIGLVVLAGCSGRKTGDITGKVTYNGKPLASGSVIFTTPNSPAVPANIKEDGTYECKDVFVGEAAVAVISPNDTSEALMTASQKPDIPAEGPKFDAKKWFSIPAKYARNSPLRFSVQAGTNTFNIELVD